MKTVAKSGIRLATPADLDALADLEALSFTSPWRRSTLARELENPLSVTLLLETVPARPPAAFICTWIIPPEAELLRIAVAPSQRRLNLGRFLLEHLLDILRHRGIKTLHLEVSEANHPALKFYDRLGFIQTGRRPGYYGRERAAALLLSRTIL
jgi:ribosomal-protein-alanine N-acetyltransferase